MAEARKTVTVVFADVSGSTELGERLDPEPMRRVMERYFAEARDAFERHGGTVEKFIGDAVVAVFGIPTSHEDDALRAVRAAAEMRERLDDLNDELRAERGLSLSVRTGVNTGEVVAGDPAGGQFFATGDAVNIAARLEQAAEVGEILLGELTHGLVRDAVRVEPLDEPLIVKGKTDALPAYRLLGLVEGAPPVTRRFDTPLVGRDDDLAYLLDCFDGAVSERIPRLVTVVGAAGIGKTRLAAELLARVRKDRRVLHGRCLSYGEGITFWPLQEILRGTEQRPSGVPDPEEATTTEETFLAYRKLFAALADERPLLVLLEDIHWAEPTLLDLIEHIVQWTHDAPMMLLCLARPELLDGRPGWPGELLELEPLAPDEAETLAAAVAFEFDAAVKARAIELAEGNPLFLEQLLLLAAEDGQRLTVPQTIQALLAARLDRIAADERGLLERAAVIGKEFWRGALLYLSPADTEVSVLLQRLIRRNLIHPERSTFPGEDAFRFAHLLIRDVAYAGISKSTRAELHERFADWLETSGQYDEIVGYHLEQAVRLNEQVQKLDARAVVLAGRAAEFLSQSGNRAFARGDLSGAKNLIERAAALSPPESDLGLILKSSLGRCLLELGQTVEAERILVDAARHAAACAQRARELEALIELSLVRSFIDPSSSDERLEFARGAVRELESLGDERALARAWRLVFDIHFTELRLGAADAALERAIEYARRAGDEVTLASGLGTSTTIAFWGPLPVPEATRRCQQILASREAQFTLHASAAGTLACLQAMVGEFEAARGLVSKSKNLYLDSGHVLSAAGQSELYAYIETLAGDHEAAMRELQGGYDTLEDLGEKGVLSTVAGYLANALYALGRDEEAYTLSLRAEEKAADDDVTSHVLWRRVRAKLAARRGASDEGEMLARQAVALLEPTDALDFKADTLRDLAHVCELGGRLNLAAEAAQHAISLYDQKGNQISARSTRKSQQDIERAMAAG